VKGSEVKWSERKLVCRLVVVVVVVMMMESQQGKRERIGRSVFGA